MPSAHVWDQKNFKNSYPLLLKCFAYVYSHAILHKHSKMVWTKLNLFWCLEEKKEEEEYERVEQICVKNLKKKDAYFYFIKFPWSKRCAGARNSKVDCK